MGREVGVLGGSMGGAWPITDGRGKEEALERRDAAVMELAVGLGWGCRGVLPEVGEEGVDVG